MTNNKTYHTISELYDNNKKADFLLPTEAGMCYLSGDIRETITNLCALTFKNGVLNRKYIYDSENPELNQKNMALALHKGCRMYLVFKDGFSVEITEKSDNNQSVLVYMQTAHLSMLIAASDGSENIETLDCFNFSGHPLQNTKSCFEFLCKHIDTCKDDKSVSGGELLHELREQYSQTL